MPIVLRAKKTDSTNDLIRKFKKLTAAADIVQIVKDRRYFQKPSRIRATKVAEMSRLERRSRSLKKTKNVSPQAIAKINQRLGS
ncbi:MAG TPA: 30S ribosomal protein S21 [Candidatus Pacebacteria bacterium]|nr:30S ribosomal protein S21 [Candidatus Paceibacterota bacterium]